MGEEEKNVEENKVEGEGKNGEGNKGEGGEKKAEGGGEGEKKEEKKNESDGRKEGDGNGNKAEGGGDGGEGEKKETPPPPPPPPPPPEEIVMRVYMHCEGCARKVQRCLTGFQGVEDVEIDCRTHKVVVKGKAAAADPLRVVDRVQKKSGRKVELLTPIPPKPEKGEQKEEEKEKPKPEEEKKEEPPVVAAVLKVRMHCDACSLEIKKRILKMKGVQSAEPDLKNSQVTVKGVFEPATLVEHVYRRTGRHAVVVKAEPAEKAAGSGEGKDGKSARAGGGEGEKDKSAGGGGGGGGEGKKQEGGEAAAEGAAASGTAAGNGGKGAEVTRNPLYYYYPRYQVEYTYPPQIFSDENPNACSVM